MSCRWGRDRWALVALLLLAWALRLPPLLDNRLHPDEALYGYWGLLVGRGQGPWLAAVPVYKPPLLPYLVAGAQALFGNAEFTVRLPGLATGLLTIPLVAALARSLYRGRWMAATAGVALSPFALLFSATAFPDPPMVALGLGACAAAARGRPGWAGLLAGLAFAAKQTGLVFLPLVLGVSLIRAPVPSSRMVRFAVGLALVVGLVFAWDRVRVAQGGESFWRMGVTGYGGLRLIWPQELSARLWGWIGLARYLFVSPVVNGVLLAGLPALVWNATTRGRYTRAALADLLLIAFCIMYALLHWLWAFPVWDRYLLPLVPVLAILLGRILALLAPSLQSIISRLPLPIRHRPSFIGHWSLVIGHWSLVIAHCSLVVLLLLPAWNAARSRYPIGGDYGAYDGIDTVAAFLGGRGEGAVVYQHWLGWPYAYYLFDAPVYLAYWPTPAWLAQDVRAFGAREPRYIAFPSWESTARVERALSGVGYRLALALTTHRRDGTPSFTVYRVLPLADP
jgi:hypothetical protein